MKSSANLSAMLSVAGGLAAATLPSVARANCSPSGGSYSQTAPTRSYPSGPQLDPQAEYAAGVKAISANDFQTAAAAFDRVLPFAPQNAMVHYLAGRARIGTGDWKGARRMLERAVRLDPRMIGAQQDLGVVYTRLAEMPKAAALVAKLEAAAASAPQGSDRARDLALAIGAIKDAMAG